MIGWGLGGGRPSEVNVVVPGGRKYSHDLKLPPLWNAIFGGT